MAELVRAETIERARQAVAQTHRESVGLRLVDAVQDQRLGGKPPQAEWGLMLNSLRQAIYVQPYVAALPGLMIFLTSMCFNLMSDGFRSAMDVRLNK